MTISPYSLISLKDMKSQFGIEGANKDQDDIIASIIDGVSAIIESYCNKNIISRTYTEYYDGKGGSFLYTKQYPIASITSIHDDSDWVWSTDTLIPSGDYMIKDNRILFRNITLGDASNNIKIVYTAGYTDTPSDIKQVCISEVIKRYKHKNDPDIVSKSLADGSISYSIKSLMDETKMVLNKYKRFGVI